MFPLRAGNLAAFSHKARFKQDCEGQVDVVSTQQNMFADSHPRDVGDAARRTGSQLEQAEIRGASADMDHQDVPRLGIVCVPPFPQRVGVGRAVLFEPAIEGGLRLFEEPHATGEPGCFRGIQGEPLRRGVERGGNRDGDFLVIDA